VPIGENLQCARKLRHDADIGRVPIGCILATTTHRGIGQRTRHRAHRDRTENDRDCSMGHCEGWLHGLGHVHAADLATVCAWMPPWCSAQLTTGIRVPPACCGLD
jgi:hypothetical protein